MRTVNRHGKAGRPPAGVNGDRVVDYPQVSVRMPPNVRDTLIALGEVRHLPHWRIMMEALSLYVCSLSLAEQEELNVLLATYSARR